MDNNNPNREPPSEGDFARIFEEMVDLLKFTVDNSDSKVVPILPKDIEDKLAKLESDIEDFCELNKAIAAAKGDSLLEKVDPLEGMSLHERMVYERSEELLLEAEEKRKLIEVELENAKASGKDFDTPEMRKKKFKRFGIRTKWNKM